MFVTLMATFSLWAQRECRSSEYEKLTIQNDPSIAASRQSVENFILQHHSSTNSFLARGQQIMRIKIPVVVHILYHYPGENISDAVVSSQVSALNRDFKKLNADTSKIPSYFKSFAADCEFEFQLAKVDPRGRATTGIIHKYTPITKWTTDDKIKFSQEMGDDGWDASSYLNIWVGTMTKVIGYSSFPGWPANKDGVVISNSVFGITNSGPYNQGRTAVHEVGHWLNLKHLWGDAPCGDDGVDDTPVQQTFTVGCPTGIRVSCGNAPNGDMYMDYMDFTNDDCLVMFTKGQMERMRVLFEPGGPRCSILSSKALGIPLIDEIPLPDTPPKWLHVQIFPNPANNKLTLDLSYDARWIGKDLLIVNITGQVQLRKTITSKIQEIDISMLKSGVYFISAEKDGSKIRGKFVKL